MRMMSRHEKPLPRDREERLREPHDPRERGEQHEPRDERQREAHLAAQRALVRGQAAR